jgi:hypothetical protein
MIWLRPASEPGAPAVVVNSLITAPVLAFSIHMRPLPSPIVSPLS